MARPELRPGLSPHHASHRNLLSHPEAPHSSATVDAVVVPSARPARFLHNAVRMAATLRCPLLVFSSRLSHAHSALSLARAVNVPVLAVDVTPELLRERLPAMQTTRLLAAARLSRRMDTSAKRNLGLLLGWAAGWERIVFLDDDILVTDAEDLRRAAGLLDGCWAVGLKISGYPDNSVLCHAYRDAGGVQDTFVGAGAMAVSPTRGDSFFPDVYNEDWFYLLDDDRLRPVAVVGEAIQRAYDPYWEPRRARSQEFGDILAEGVYALLDDGRRVWDGSRRYWASYLRHRAAFGAQVTAMVRSGALLPEDQRARMLRSLWAAQRRRSRVTPDLCLAFVRAWRADRRRWQRHLAAIPCGQGLERAAEQLGLRDCLCLP